LSLSVQLNGQNYIRKQRTSREKLFSHRSSLLRVVQARPCRSSQRNTFPQPSPGAKIPFPPVFFLRDKEK